MSNDIVIGEIDWNSGDDGGSKTEFMRLEQGESTVREELRNGAGVAATFEKYGIL